MPELGTPEACIEAAFKIRRVVFASECRAGALEAYQAFHERLDEPPAPNAEL